MPIKKTRPRWNLSTWETGHSAAATIIPTNPPASPFWQSRLLPWRAILPRAPAGLPLTAGARLRLLQQPVYHGAALDAALPLLFYVCVRLFNLGINEALFLTLAFGLGTLAFPYSTAFYCHQPAAFCLFFSLVLALHIRHGSSQKKQTLAAAAGLLGATGVLIEPSSLYLLAAVFIYLVGSKSAGSTAPFSSWAAYPPALPSASTTTAVLANHLPQAMILQILLLW